MCVCKLLAVRWTKDLPKLRAGLEAGPLLIFDKFGSVLVISAFDSFMAASYEHDDKNSTVSWGIMGKVNSILKGFQYSTIMYYGASGINKVVYMFFFVLILNEIIEWVSYVGYYDLLCLISTSVSY